MSQINVGFDNNSPQSIDRAYGKLVAGSTVPFASVAEAIAAVQFRHRGRTLLIDLGDGSGAQEYWWRVGIGDGQLVPKLLLDQVWDFVVGDGGAFTPADQSQTTPNQPALQNCKILGITGDQGPVPTFARINGTQYATYATSTGIITLTNTIFSLGTWWQIKYRQL